MKPTILASKAEQTKVVAEFSFGSRIVTGRLVIFPASESQTGDILNYAGCRCGVSGRYVSLGCHSVTQRMNVGDIFPPCPYCHQDVAWCLK